MQLACKILQNTSLVYVTVTAPFTCYRRWQ